MKALMARQSRQLAQQAQAVTDLTREMETLRAKMG
jgi:hypothetical protein